MPRKQRPNFAAQEPITVSIENLSHDGRGITHIQGKTVFISGALPGETLQFQYLRQRGSFDEGRAVQIIERSEHRQQPSCPHFGVCGGCSLQHIHLASQLKFKQKTFQELLWRAAKLEPKEWLPPIESPGYGYRRKARLGIKYIAKKNRAIIGFRELGGRLITDSRRCEVLVPAIGLQMGDFAEVISCLSIRDKIPQLEVAAGDNANAVVIRHLESFNLEDLQAIKAFAEKYDWRIYLQPQATDSIHQFYPADGEDLYYQLPRYDLKLEFQPWQFIQINASVNQSMIDLALQLLECRPNDHVLDLFCGIGNFSLPMAQLGAEVIGIEADEKTVLQAQHNAQINQLSSCEFHCGDLFQTPFSASWARKKYHKILLDPPRTGADHILRSIKQWQPEKIVYVSCDLNTLTRDSQILCQQGYQLQTAGVMDMFPHTQHVEAITLFTPS